MKIRILEPFIFVIMLVIVIGCIPDVPLSTASEIDVSSDGTVIVSGVTPIDYGFISSGTDTDKTFIITNSGNAPLNITTVDISGDTNHYTLPISPISPVQPDSTTTFVIRLVWGAGGGPTDPTVVTVNNDDPDESDFNFNVTGDPAC